VKFKGENKEKHDETDKLDNDYKQLKNETPKMPKPKAKYGNHCPD
jgi:hypothetical protein